MVTTYDFGLDRAIISEKILINDKKISNTNMSPFFIQIFCIYHNTSSLLL